MKKLSALILSLALSAALLAGCGASASSAASSEAVSSEVVSEAVSEEAVSTAEAIQFTFTVTGADGESTVLTLDAADGEKLSTALADAGIISAEEAESGFVTVVNHRLQQGRFLVVPDRRCGRDDLRRRGRH